VSVTNSKLSWLSGRPFFCLSVCAVLSLHVCPVCDVGALWSNGWKDQDATWYGGRPRPRRHCVRQGPSYPHRKGHNNPQIGFSVYGRRPWPMSVVTKRSPISATAFSSHRHVDRRRTCCQLTLHFDRRKCILPRSHFGLQHCDGEKDRHEVDLWQPSLLFFLVSTCNTFWIFSKPHFSQLCLMCFTRFVKLLKWWHKAYIASIILACKTYNSKHTVHFFLYLSLT